jgi:DNA topoisomerase-1
MLDAITGTARDVSEASISDAEAAGLRFATDAEPGITRRRAGKGFHYLTTAGRPLKDQRTLKRIAKLAIPPAWTDVWICPLADGHIQATGRDARNRKQYRYHAAWSRTRDEVKYERLARFAKSLPRIRSAVRRHMRVRGLGRTKVLATVVHLLEVTLVRVGNKEYARENGSYGLTTLQDRHVDCGPSALRFRFRGKTGKEWRLKVSDRRVARIVRSCQELPGQHLFQYEDDEGVVRQISSADVNAYLREVAGWDVTAKDFRTWAATVLMALELAHLCRCDAGKPTKRNVRSAIEAVASRLGNTPTICRKCYIHPEVLNSYLDGYFAAAFKIRGGGRASASSAALRPEEKATLALLGNRSRSQKLSLRQALAASR